jgi:hypothetical protein
MPSRHLLAALQALVEIRAAQSAAAAAAVGAAQRDAVDAQSQLDEANDLQAARGEAWSGLLAAPRFDLMLARAWSQAVSDGEAQVASASQAAARADDRLLNARDDARGAEARREGARILARNARRRARRRADETAIAEAADRFAQRGVVR